MANFLGPDRVGAAVTAAFRVICNLPESGRSSYLFTTFDLAQEWMLKKLPQVQAQAGADIRQDDEQVPRELENMNWPQIRAHVESLDPMSRFALKCYTDGMGFEDASLYYCRVETRDSLPE